MWIAKLFDGVHPEALWVQLTLADGRLHLTPGAEALSLQALAALPSASTADEASQSLMLGDGRVLQLVDGRQEFAAVLHAQGWPEAPLARALARWRRSWVAAMLALGLLAAHLAMLDQWVLPAMAQGAASLMPQSVQQRFGQTVLHELQKGYIEQFQLALPRWKELRESICERVRALDPELVFELSMYEPKDGKSLNALTLPGGQVLVFSTLADALDDEELTAVIAHELGHVKYRHGIQGLAKAVGLGAIASLTVGDFSSTATSLLVGIRAAAYSHGMEEQADAYAASLLKQLGISPTKLADALEKIDEQTPAGQAMPDWLSTHPGTASRAVKARQAADEQADPAPAASASSAGTSSP